MTESSAIWQRGLPIWHIIGQVGAMRWMQTLTSIQCLRMLSICQSKDRGVRREIVELPPATFNYRAATADKPASRFNNV